MPSWHRNIDGYTTEIDCKTDASALRTAHHPRCKAIYITRIKNLKHFEFDRTGGAESGGAAPTAHSVRFVMFTTGERRTIAPRPLIPLCEPAAAA